MTIITQILELSFSNLEPQHFYLQLIERKGFALIDKELEICFCLDHNAMIMDNVDRGDVGLMTMEEGDVLDMNITCNVLFMRTVIWDYFVIL